MVLLLLDMCTKILTDNVHAFTGYLPDASIFKLEYGKSRSLRTCMVVHMTSIAYKPYTEVLRSNVQSF